MDKKQLNTWLEQKKEIGIDAANYAKALAKKNCHYIEDHWKYWDEYFDVNFTIKDNIIKMTSEIEKPPEACYDSESFYEPYLVEAEFNLDEIYPEIGCADVEYGFRNRENEFLENQKLDREFSIKRFKEQILIAETGLARLGVNINQID